MVAGAENMSAISAVHLWRERLVCALLFLFPILGVSVDHWFSGIYALLFLISLTCLADKSHYRIHSEERLLLYCLAAYFCTFLLAALINGWTDLQTRYLGVEIRYLTAIPLYLMVRRFPDAGRWLLLGGTVAAAILAAQAYYDVNILNMKRAQGVYSPNLLGPFAALIAAWVLVELRKDDFFSGKKRWVLPLLFIAALVAVALSGSRGAYLGLVVMLSVWFLIALRGWYRFVAIMIFAMTAFGTYSIVDSVNKRVNIVADEVETYFSIEDVASYEGELPANTQRLEIWRTATLIIKDAPLFGIGRGNFERVASEYAQQGLVHPMGAQAGHAHNVYLDVMASRGIIGFVVFMALVLYPLYFFYSTRARSPMTALLGVTLIVGFMTFSISDASTFLKGNFASIFLLYLTVFFSWHVRKVREVAQ